MKKSSFVAMILGTVGGILSAIGMCMCLLPEWNMFAPGVVMGVVGIIVFLVMVGVWRKMENKTPVRLTGKNVLTVILGTAGALMLGVGMCLIMVWSKMVFGVLVGIVGIIMLISLVPLIKGLK